MSGKKIRGVTLGDGKTKICVPVTSEKYDEIIHEMKNIHDNFSDNVDLIELRIDYFEDVFSDEKLVQLLKDVRNCIGEMPLLFTFRTKNEGGERDSTIEQYSQVLHTAIDSGMIDAVDVEVMRDEKIFSAVKKYAFSRNILVIASYHDFFKTPDEPFIINMLKKMEMMDANVAKIAVMPKTEADVLKLMKASLEAKQQVKIPIITISMGKLGEISRIAGNITGSAVTFGVAEKASAPGQIDAVKLSDIINILNH